MSNVLQLGEWEKALEVYKGICSAGLQPTVSTFNALMTALCRFLKPTKHMPFLFDEMYKALLYASGIIRSVGPVVQSFLY